MAVEKVPEKGRLNKEAGSRLMHVLSADRSA
jgi:hypothetical protein